MSLPRPAVRRNEGTRAWRWLAWRAVLVLMGFSIALAAFHLGVDVTDRAGVAQADLLTKVYYSVGLFVLGGLDLGVPTGGTAIARGLLWAAYFVCPAITVSAVVEGASRLLSPRVWALRHINGHIVVGGCGRLASLYLNRLEEVNPSKPLLVVDRHADTVLLDQARQRTRTQVIQGDVSSTPTLSQLNLERADRVHLMTDNDFANIEAATKVIDEYPALRGRVVLHLTDISMLRLLPGSHLLDHVELFNYHEIAARHLVDSRLADHFEQTEHKDTVVLAGFGRFGQSVLAELQERANDAIQCVIVVDIDADQRAAVFADQIGFDQSHDLRLVNGDMADPRVWEDVQQHLQSCDREPVFVLGSDDDGKNLSIALSLSNKFPSARIVALCFRELAFAKSLSARCPFDVVSSAELVARSMPEHWFW